MIFYLSNGLHQRLSPGFYADIKGAFKLTAIENRVFWPPGDRVFKNFPVKINLPPVEQEPQIHASLVNLDRL